MLKIQVRLRDVMKIGWILFALLINFCLSAKEDVEKGFYSLSALRYFLETEEEGINYTERDIDFLWEQTINSLPANENMRKALDLYLKSGEERSLENEVNDLLYCEWLSLRSILNADWESCPANSLHGKLNPNLSSSIYKAVKDYLIPTTHYAYSKLEGIFGKSHVTQNRQTLLDARFAILDVPSSSGITLATHPDLPGWIFKIYLDDVSETRGGIPGWQWLVDRCVGADNVRKIIIRKNLKHFSVPEKFLYAYPSDKCHAQAVLLLATDMEILVNETANAWKTVTTKHLDELYKIISHGYGSTSIVSNIPYTKSGKFAFIDTEYPKRKLQFSKVKWFLSVEMGLYWDRLVTKGGS